MYYSVVTISLNIEVSFSNLQVIHDKDYESL